MKQFLKKSALALAALAGAAGAQATTIDFDSGVDTSLAAGAPYFLLDRDAVIQKGFAIGVGNVNNGTNASDGSLVGALFDPSINSCDSATLTCPTGNSTTYLAAYNDAVPFIQALDGSAFSLSSFSASFIGTPGNTNTQASGVPAGLIRLFVVQSDGTSGYLTAQFQLKGTDSSGNLSFADFIMPTSIQALSLVEVDFVGYSCNGGGNCNAFTTNKGQIALDNINVTAVVPEPASWLLAFVGLGAVGAVVRRRRSA